MDSNLIARSAAESLLNSLPAGIAIALIAWVITRAVRGFGASVRFAVWLVALAAFPFLLGDGSSATSSSQMLPSPAAEAVTLPASLAIYFLVFWILGAGFGLVRLVVSLCRLHRLRGTGIALAPYAMVTLFFTALYMMVPNTRVQWRAALTGAVVAGVLWAAVGKIFTAFFVYSTRLTIVYAGFAFMVAALLWTYFGWLILLAGAQLSFYVQNPAYLRLGLQQLRLSSVELEELTLKIMYLVGHAHVAGGRRWTVSRLADELGPMLIEIVLSQHSNLAGRETLWL